ncbi:MAG: dihydropteroate synthase [Odoribacter sp.]|nr:dihydropteroate synthase [Odoribacter sp.]
MKTITLNKKSLDFSTPVVMGILNVTPDSFYDGGKYVSEVKVIERIHQIVEEGAGIIDVGAYSTRLGAAFVDEKEELARLAWAVELVRKYYPDVVVSIDTFRSAVAREIIDCLGDVIVNDISGGTMDDGMFDFVAQSGVPYIMMHIQGTPQTMQLNPVYENVVKDVRKFFTDRIAMLNEAGFDNIILDPGFGFGFGKTLDHNYELMDGMDSYLDLEYPILVGISRKTMIYKLIGGTANEALNGTTVLNTLALLKGASILRVHDVREAVEAVKITEKMRRR